MHLIATKLILLSLYLVAVVAKNSAHFDVNTPVNLVNSTRFSWHFPSTCEEAVQQQNVSNGIYLLQVPTYPDAFFVTCLKDPRGGPAWTVIQERRCGLVNFYREWLDYAIGFGDLNSEYFIGLKKINALTSYRRHELWVQLEDFEGNQAYATYDQFEVGNEKTNYTLNSIGKYNGTAGDSLIYSIGAQFSTKDRENNTPSACARQHRSGWWLRYCSLCDLNGPYHGNGLEVAVERGIQWRAFKGATYSLKYAHMAIRPKK